MKTLVIGGTQDFGKGVTDFFGPEAVGVGRSNGYDIQDPSRFDELVSMSLNFDVVIVVAHVGALQNKLIEKIASTWMDSNFAGYLFGLGSTAIYHDKYDRPLADWKYLRDKEGLRQLTKYITFRSTIRGVNMRYTSLHLGRLDNIKARKRTGSDIGIKPDELGRIIQFLVDTPPHLCVHEMYIDPKY